MRTNSRGPVPWGPMGATALLWGSAFPTIRIALSGYPPTSIAVLRIAVALLLLLPFALFGKVGRLRRADFPRMAAFGLTGMTAYQLLLYAGERSVEGGTAALLITASPVFATLLGMVCLSERLTRGGLLGLATAVSGAVLVALTAAGDGGTPAGALSILLAALAQATSFVLQKPLLTRYSGVECTFYGSLFGILPLLPFLRSALAHTGAAPGHSNLAVVWLGAACTALAFWTWSRALRAATAGTASLVLYAVPVAALGLDAVLLGDAPAPQALGGAALVLTGIAVTARAGRGGVPA
ncbi:DMT family transporter, partial [Streptomyces sp. NPDC059918]|uniref:DMT family transporter n=1 Tax=Streptomyces sp. NPDC059918 TaxID=3347003 RepID=UPI00365D0F8D